MFSRFGGHRTAILIMVISLLAAAAAGCGSQAPPAPAAPPRQATASREWQADGVISEGEYTLTQKVGDIEVFSRLEGDTVMLGLRAQTSGWLAIGIDPEDKMKGADIILAQTRSGPAIVDKAA